MIEANGKQPTQNDKVFRPEVKQVPSFSELLIRSVDFLPLSKIILNIGAEEICNSSTEVSSDNDKKKEYSIEEILSAIAVYSQEDEFRNLPNCLSGICKRKMQVFKVHGRGKGKKQRREFLRTEEFKKKSLDSGRRSRTIEEEKIYERALITTLKLSSSKEEIEKNKRKIKVSLNKLSPSNCEKLQVELFNLIKESQELLVYFTQNLFEKACAEIKYTEMYAQICKYMKQQLEGFVYEEGSPLKRNRNWFRYVLLNTVQNAFEGNHEESNKSDGNQNAVVKKKAHGSVRFIGELLKVRMFPPKIIQVIAETLIGLSQNDPMSVIQENIELACVMISTIGIVNEKKKLVDDTNKIFEFLGCILQKNEELSPKVRFRIMDLIDERKSGWIKDVSELPKHVDELRNEFQNEHEYRY